MEKSRLVFMGSDSFSVPILDRLLSAGQSSEAPFRAVGVVTQPDRQAGRGRKQLPNPVKVIAQGERIPVLQPRRLRDESSVVEVLALDPDVVVVASYGQFLPIDLLERPLHKCLNLHPSLLPRGRGPSPLLEPLLAGETTTGVSLMQMSDRMDAGPIIDQVATDIQPNETAGQLRPRLAQLSADLLLKNLPGWLKGEIGPVPQDDSGATYTKLVTKEDGLIDWSLPAEVIARRVRAFNPWPGAYTHLRGKLLKVLSAAPAESRGESGRVLGFENGGLVVGTGTGSLIVTTLQLAGGKVLPAVDFLRGHPEILEARLG